MHRCMEGHVSCTDFLALGLTPTPSFRKISAKKLRKSIIHIETASHRDVFVLHMHVTSANIHQVAVHESVWQATVMELRQAQYLQHRPA
jgi:hypothetical protein